MDTSIDISDENIITKPIRKIVPNKEYVLLTIENRMEHETRFIVIGNEHIPSIITMFKNIEKYKTYNPHNAIWLFREWKKEDMIKLVFDFINDNSIESFGVTTLKPVSNRLANYNIIKIMPLPVMGTYIFTNKSNIL